MSSKSNDTTLSLSGSCQSGSTVKVFNGTTLLGTADVNGTQWTFSGSVSPENNYQFNVEVIEPQPVADPSIVVFDLVGGKSSSRSGRTFDSSTDYTIYIRVDSTSKDLKGGGEGWGAWSGGENLGAATKIVLVGNGTKPKGGSSKSVTKFFTKTTTGGVQLVWGCPPSQTLCSARACRITFSEGGNGSGDVPLIRSLHGIQSMAAGLIKGGVTKNRIPNKDLTLNDIYLATMPPNVMHTQGLT